MNYLNSAQYQAMYNQIYSGATTNPLQGERFEHRDFQYDGVRNESSQPIPIEVKKTVAVKLEMSIDKKSIELVCFFKNKSILERCLCRGAKKAKIGC